MFKHYGCQNFIYKDAEDRSSVVALDLYLGDVHDVIVCTDRTTHASIEWTAAKVTAFFGITFDRLIWIAREERPMLVQKVLRVLAIYKIATFQIDPSTREIRGVTLRPMTSGDWAELGIPSPSDLWE